MSDDVHAQLLRERLVRENLAARVGQLTAENIELQLRIHELEHPDEMAAAVNGETPTRRRGGKAT